MDNMCYMFLGVPISSGDEWRGRVHTGQVTHPLQGIIGTHSTHTLIAKDNLMTN